MKIIPNIEKLFHAIIYLAVLVLLGKEVMYMFTAQSVAVDNILQMFIFMELLQMVSIFFSSGKIPVRYPLYISLIALARHISLENIIGLDALYLSSSILLIALALVGLGYRDKLLNHKEPELE